jgi:hypothetical protein
MEVSGQLHNQAALGPRTHCIGGWEGSRAGLDVVDKRNRCVDLIQRNHVEADHDKVIMNASFLQDIYYASGPNAHSPLPSYSGGPGFISRPGGQSGFLQSCQANAWIVPQIGPGPLAYTYGQVHYSLCHSHGY